MTIREITEADIPALIHICDSCEHLPTERSTIYWMFAKFFPRTSLVAEIDGKVVGTLLGFQAQVEPSYGFVHILGVLPEFRSRGIARKLLKHFEDVVSSKGAPFISLTAATENEIGKIFYELVGFSAPRAVQKAGNTRFEFVRPCEIRNDT